MPLASPARTVRKPKALGRSVWFSFAIACCAAFAGPAGIMAAEAETAAYDLTPDVSPDRTRQVKAVLEVQGELKLNADGRQVTRLPLKVRADLLYGERILAADRETGRRRDARLYERASAEIKVGEMTRQNRLREPQQLVIVDSDAEATRLYSPAGPLTREELEIVDIQANSSLLAQLLPSRKVPIGDRWTHDDRLVARLLRLDAVHQNSLASSLRKVNKRLAIIDLSGAVSGAVAGISTDIEIKAVYNFNLHSRQVTWLALSLSEDRAIGHAEPGLDVTGRLRLATVPRAVPAELSDEALASFDLAPNSGALLLRHDSEAGGYRLLHDRQWRVMIDRHDVAVLRRVEQGDLVAQCNISSLQDLKPGQHPQLEAFQADVRRALGDDFGDFVEASQNTTESGLRVLRTVVSGAVSGIPIQWTYYHFSNEEGRQLSMVFTLDSKLVEQFAANDVALVSSFEFRPQSDPPVTPVETSSERRAGRPSEAVGR